MGAPGCTFTNLGPLSPARGREGQIRDGRVQRTEDPGPEKAPRGGFIPQSPSAMSHLTAAPPPPPQAVALNGPSIALSTSWGHYVLLPISPSGEH